MHRSNGRNRSLIWGTLLALALSGLAGYGQAQPMSETILVPLGGTTKVQMKTKKPIAKAEAKRDGVISIRPVLGDPTTIQLLGQSAETTELRLTDTDGKVETYLVIVQRDVENLKAQLRRAIPASAIVVTPMNEGTVLLTGTIARAADAPVIEQVVRALGFNPINQVSVGGVQQVQLDVVVAIVSRSAIRSFAFDFLTNSHNFYFASVGSGAAGAPISAAGSAVDSTGVEASLSSAVGGLVNTVGAPNGQGTNLLFGVLHNGWNFLGFLQALREENLLKVIAEPHLVTMSGTTASFISGGEQAIPVPAGLGQIGVQFEEFGTRLNFLPIVLGDGRIHLEVEPEFSTLDAANGVNIEGTTVPGRDTNRVHTTVNVEDGHTFVIGGLIQHQIIGSTLKVPVLGDLPYIGTMFSRKAYQDTENEVLIVVTPHVVEAVDCAQAPKILPGQETRNPDDYELFLEGILEAPRGQRCVYQDNHYVPAYKNGPSAGVFPCGDGCPNCSGAGRGGCGAPGCGMVGGCANGSCASGEASPAPLPKPAVMPPPAPPPQTQAAPPQPPAAPQQLPQVPDTLPPTTQLPAASPTPLPTAPVETPLPAVSDTAAATGAMPVVPTPAAVEPLRPVPPPEPTSQPTTPPTTLPNVVPTPNGGQLP